MLPRLPVEVEGGFCQRTASSSTWLGVGVGVGVGSRNLTLPLPLTLTLNPNPTPDLVHDGGANTALVLLGRRVDGLEELLGLEARLR